MLQNHLTDPSFLLLMAKCIYANMPSQGVRRASEWKTQKCFKTGHLATQETKLAAARLVEIQVRSEAETLVRRICKQSNAHCGASRDPWQSKLGTPESLARPCVEGHFTPMSDCREEMLDDKSLRECPRNSQSDDKATLRDSFCV
jgi:hypothetical protein